MSEAEEFHTITGFNDERLENVVYHFRCDNTFYWYEGDDYVQANWKMEDGSFYYWVTNGNVDEWKKWVECPNREFKEVEIKLEEFLRKKAEEELLNDGI